MQTMERLGPLGFSRCGQGGQGAALTSPSPSLDKVTTQEAVVNGEEETTKYTKDTKNGRQGTALTTKVNSDATSQADRLKEKACAKIIALQSSG
jgi:hypothetical protein